MIQSVWKEKPEKCKELLRGKGCVAIVPSWDIVAGVSHREVKRHAASIVFRKDIQIIQETGRRKRMTAEKINCEKCAGSDRDPDGCVKCINDQLKASEEQRVKMAQIVGRVTDILFPNKLEISTMELYDKLEEQKKYSEIGRALEWLMHHKDVEVVQFYKFEPFGVDRKRFDTKGVVEWYKEGAGE